LSSPPPVLLIILPYTVNAVVKIASSLVSKKSRRQSIEDILTRNKPPDAKPLLTDDQITVLDGAISQSNLYVTTTATLMASMLAILVITLKSGQPWLWWVLLGIGILSFLMWLWIYTRKSFAAKGLFSISVGTWALIVFCAFDVSLAVLSIIVSSPAAQPANSTGGLAGM
jgi:hypothetical protein